MNEKDRQNVEYAKKVKERKKEQNAKQQLNFDRVSSVLPKGTKERIKNAGYSVNDFIVKSVLEKLEAIEDK